MSFLKLLENKKIILLDGAMGTQLDKRGLMACGRNNLDAPDAVLEIHREYCRCGCNAITTNTLTMNRIFIETHNVGVDVSQVNKAGAELARRAVDSTHSTSSVQAGSPQVGKTQYVLGDISSTGQLLEPYGTYKEAQFYDAFKEQAEILALSGVDGFIIETMFDLKEALCALRVCKDNFSLPVIVSIAFNTEAKGARTIMGNSAKDCAGLLADGGADVIGANCGSLDPIQMSTVVSMLKGATTLPILAQPNAGKPRLIDDKTIFEMDPQSFAAGMRKCIDAGARLAGGCCGTTPAHIQALADILNKKK